MFTCSHDKQKNMKPLMLDLSDSHILVIGDGTVGKRKAAYFEGVAEVTIIDSVPENLVEALFPYDFVIAATASEEENKRICVVAARLGIWYNSATGMGNVMIPAVFEEDGFTLAVSTNGKAPAVSAFIRDKIREAYPALPAMIALQETVRGELKTLLPEQSRRAEILRAILDDAEIWGTLNAGETEEALTIARRLYEH